MNQYLKTLTQKQAACVIALVAWAFCLFVAYLAQMAVDSLIQAWSNGVGASGIVMVLSAASMATSIVALMLAIHLSIRCMHALNS